MNRALIAAAAIDAGLAVAAGAFGAHALRARLEPRALDIFETASRYQMYHALAILGCAVIATGGARAAGWIMQGGIVVFCGSLYALALSDVRWLGAITPIGGLAFVVGWLWLAVSAFKP